MHWSEPTRWPLRLLSALAVLVLIAPVLLITAVAEDRDEPDTVLEGEMHPDLWLWSLEGKRTNEAEAVNLIIKNSEEAKAAAAIIPALVGGNQRCPVIIADDATNIEGVTGADSIIVSSLGATPAAASIKIAQDYWENVGCVIIVEDYLHSIQAAPIASLLCAPILIGVEKADIESFSPQCVIGFGTDVPNVKGTERIIELEDADLLEFQMEIYESRGIWADTMVVANTNDVTLGDEYAYSLLAAIYACQYHGIVVPFIPVSTPDDVEDARAEESAYVTLVKDDAQTLRNSHIKPTHFSLEHRDHLISDIIIAGGDDIVPGYPHSTNARKFTDWYYADLTQDDSVVPTGLGDMVVSRIDGGTNLEASMVLARSIYYEKFLTDSIWTPIPTPTVPYNKALILDGSSKDPSAIVNALGASMNVTQWGTDDLSVVNQETFLLICALGNTGTTITVNNGSADLDLEDATTRLPSVLVVCTDETPDVSSLAGNGYGAIVHLGQAGTEAAFFTSLLNGDSVGEAYASAIGTHCNDGILVGDPKYVPLDLIQGNELTITIPYYVAISGTFETGKFVTVGIRAKNQDVGGFDSVVVGDFDVEIDGVLVASSIESDQIEQARPQLPEDEGQVALDIIYTKETGEKIRFRYWIEVKEGEPDQNLIGIIVPSVIWVLSLVAITFYFILHTHHKRIQKQKAALDKLEEIDKQAEEDAPKAPKKGKKGAKTKGKPEVDSK